MAVAESTKMILGEPVETFLVDTDVHEVMPTADVLKPYLAPEWHRFMKYGPVLGSGLPHVQPNQQAYRAEWRQGGGDTPDRTFYGLAGHNIDLLRKDLLVGENVSVAILNPGGLASGPACGGYGA